MALFLTAIALVPIMLCVKPCCFRGGPDKEEHEEIQMSDISREGSEHNMSKDSNMAKEVSDTPMAKREADYK